MGRTAIVRRASRGRAVNAWSRAIRQTVPSPTFASVANACAQRARTVNHRVPCIHVKTAVYASTKTTTTFVNVQPDLTVGPMWFRFNSNRLIKVYFFASNRNQLRDQHLWVLLVVKWHESLSQWCVREPDGLLQVLLRTRIYGTLLRCRCQRVPNTAVQERRHLQEPGQQLRMHMSGWLRWQRLHQRHWRVHQQSVHIRIDLHRQSGTLCVHLHSRHDGAQLWDRHRWLCASAVQEPRTLYGPAEWIPMQL